MFASKGIHTMKTRNKLGKINLLSQRSHIVTLPSHHTDQDDVKWLSKGCHHQKVLVMLYKNEAHSHMGFQVLTPKPSPARAGDHPDTG